MNKKLSNRLFTIVLAAVVAVVFFTLGCLVAFLWSPQYLLKLSSISVDEQIANNESVEIVGKVSLNTATKEELMSINGIGEVYAQRIIEYREISGGFRSLEELMNVKGVGETRYREWSTYLTLE